MNLGQRIQRTALFLIALGAFGIGFLALIGSYAIPGMALLALGVISIVWMSRIVSDSSIQPPAESQSSQSSKEEADFSKNSSEDNIQIEQRNQVDNHPAEEDEIKGGNFQPPLVQPKLKTSGPFVQVSVKKFKPVPFGMALLGIVGGMVIGYFVGRSTPSNSQQVSGGGLNLFNQAAPVQQNQNQQNVQAGGEAQSKAGPQQDGTRQAKLNINGKNADILYSEVDMGQIENVFDGKLDTLLRGKAANPYTIQANFSEIISVSMVSVRISAMSNAKVSVAVVKEDGSSVADSQEWAEDKPEQTLNFSLTGAPVKIKSLRIEILDRRPPPGEGFHTHVYEVSIK